MAMALSPAVVAALMLSRSVVRAKNPLISGDSTVWARSFSSL